jgi:hypothetical protein
MLLGGMEEKVENHVTACNCVCMVVGGGGGDTPAQRPQSVGRHKRHLVFKCETQEG